MSDEPKGPPSPDTGENFWPPRRKKPKKSPPPSENNPRPVRDWPDNPGNPVRRGKVIQVVYEAQQRSPIDSRTRRRLVTAQQILADPRVGKRVVNRRSDPLQKYVAIQVRRVEAGKLDPQKAGLLIVDFAAKSVTRPTTSESPVMAGLKKTPQPTVAMVKKKPTRNLSQKKQGKI